MLTTAAESPPGCDKPVLHEDILECHPTVIRAMMVQKLSAHPGEWGLVVGVDPGRRTGLSVFYCGREIESSFYASAGVLASHIVHLLGRLQARTRVVKIGDGEMGVARRIASMISRAPCPPFDLEFVDEHRTSPRTKNLNQGGRRDRLSARYISQRDGRRHRIPMPVA